MNLGNIESNLYRRLGFKTTPATEVTTRLRAFINQVQRELLGQKGLSQLRRAILTCTSTASSPFMSLPQAAVRIITIQDRTNRWLLMPISLEDLRVEDPGLTALTSNPDSYIILNMAAPVNLEPSAAAQLSAKSTSASDDSTKEVFVEGVRTDGYYGTTSIVLNGVTAVNLPTITDFIKITKFYLTLATGGQATAAGSVTLHEGTGGTGTEMARIPIGRSYARYTRLQLYPTPSAAITYYIDCELHIEDMAEANDEPYLPEEFHWLLDSGAFMKECLRIKDMAAYNAEKSAYKSGVGDLKVWVSRTSGAAMSDHRSGTRRWSQLGPYYPVGS